MVRAYLPQGKNESLETNTNSPPQGDFPGGGSPPVLDLMLFQNSDEMLFQEGEKMEYQS